MRNIFVTGATSMLGTALIEECLKHGVNVYASSRPNSEKIKRLPKSELLHVIECDASELGKINPLDFPNIDVFYHFGWTFTDKTGRNNPDLQVRNIMYSIEALKLAKSLGCTKFIGAGSQAEYGIHKEPITTTSTIPEPFTAYGISKFAAGKLCGIEAEKLGINFVWVRIFSVYGENDGAESMITTILHKLINNEHCALTLGVQNWDYLYSSDAGRAFYLIGEAETGKSKIYCLGSGKARSIRSYIEEMKEVTGSKSELGFGEIPYENNIPPGMCADISALTRDTGFVPSVSFKEGIKLISKINYMGGGTIF